MSRDLRKVRTRVSNRVTRYDSFFAADDDEDIRFHGRKYFPGDSDNVAMHEWMKSCGFSVGKSLLPGAGKGLFYNGSKDLPAGTFVGWYTGMKITSIEAMGSSSDYIMSSSDGKIHIDASPIGEREPCMLARANDNLLSPCDDSHLSVRKEGNKLAIYTRRFISSNRSEPQELYLHYGVEYWYPNKILYVDWRTRLEWWRREQHLFYKVSATPEQLALFEQQLAKDKDKELELKRQAEKQARHDALSAKREEALLAKVRGRIAATSNASRKRVRLNSAQTARKKKRALPYWSR